MNKFETIACIVIVLLPSLAMADSGKFCSYLMDFGLSTTDKKTKLEEYSLRNCKKGDVINMRITDTDKLGREAMYMAGEIAEICDNTLPVSIISLGRAVCTYRGSRRNIRRSE